MFSFKKTKPKMTDLEEEITDAIRELRNHYDNPEEYANLAGAVKTLIEAKAVEEKTDHSFQPSADTIALVAGNLLGIIAILTFEKANVITSKSLNLVLKPKN